MINLPTPDVYWGVPQRREIGDADEDDIHLQVGRALSGWEGVEFLFSKLFGVFVGGRSPIPTMQIAEAAYGAIASHGGRSEALQQAGAMFFHFNRIAAEENRDFCVLLDHFDRGASIRNSIAHGIVIHYMVDNATRGTFLEPPSYNSLKTVKTKFEIHVALGISAPKVKYSYVSDDIASFSEKFRSLRGEVHRFYMHMFQAFCQLPSLPGQ